uniref:Uncharacterized protein n=1 Tax=Octopus bimaculoides TaxID=37653 RepID=A0A0L8GWV5_OCTBM
MYEENRYQKTKRNTHNTNTDLYFNTQPYSKSTNAHKGAKHEAHCTNTQVHLKKNIT